MKLPISFALIFHLIPTIYLSGTGRKVHLRHIMAIGTGENKTAKTFLRIWSWSIEALGGVGALSVWALIGEKEAVDMFLLQEVRWEGTHDFIIKEGWRFISIGEKNSFAGMAFLLAPKIHIGVIGYLLLCDRVATLLLRTVTGPALFINLHAETEDKPLELIKRI